MKDLFQGAYCGTRVLVTGHTGFKGSWLCLWLRALGANVSALALPAATSPSHWHLLKFDSVKERLVDLREATAVRDTLRSFRPQIIFHLAAQSLVRRSYQLPAETFATNVSGLVNLFEAIRDCPSSRVVINATTDKVYLESSAGPAYTESDPLGGHDPYSTSKACAELVTECYRKSFFSGSGSLLPQLATARAGNVIGGGDWAADRLVPDMVRAAVAGRPLQLRNPGAVRPWQHVLEPLSGYLRLGQALLAGESVEGSWNFGPSAGATRTVQEMATRMQSYWPGVRIESASGPHPHEAASIALDCSKARDRLDWFPIWNADTTIRRTIDWYRALYQTSEVRSISDLNAYVDAARAADCAWARST